MVINALGNECSCEKTLDILHEAGFNYVDITLWAYSQPGSTIEKDDWREWAQRIREYADKIGVKIRQTHGNTLTGMQWDDYNYPLWDYTWENNHRAVEITKILGAQWMVMHPTNLPHDPYYSRSKARDENLRYLAPFIEDAKKHGVGIAVENMVDFRGNRRRYCGGDPEELIELVDMINDEAVGICIDTGHAHQAGINVGSYIRMAGDRIKSTHINDNNREGDSHLPPFFGSIDWLDTMQAFKDINYQGDFSFELANQKFKGESIHNWYRFIRGLGDDLLNMVGLPQER
jgi:sugar phosphate isomerase/epimerase